MHFLTIGTTSKEYSIQEKKELVVCAVNVSVITRNLYNMANDEILRRYVPKFEQGQILAKEHGGATGGNYAGHATAQIFFAQGCGGQPFTRIQKHTVRPMIYVKGLENHHGGMRCH